VQDAEENMRNDTWGAPDADGRVWNRKSFPLITAGSIDIFASRKSCNVHIQRNRGNILSDHLECGPSSTPRPPPPPLPPALLRGCLALQQLTPSEPSLTCSKPCAA
jgi:hypothetical protein